MQRQQEEREVVVAATAGVPVHGCHQRIQRLVAAGGEKGCGDLVVREEVPVLVAAFDQAVGVESALAAHAARAGRAAPFSHRSWRGSQGG